MEKRQNLLIGLLVALSLPIGLYAFIFQLQLSGDPEFHQRFALTPVFAAFHIVGSGVALLVGGFQFFPGIRRRNINLHRWLGRIYLLAVLVGGTGGLVLSQGAAGGLVSKIGFAMLGVLWLYSGWQAYAAVRAGDIVSHRRWMTRSFGLTFAAVTLRIYLGLLTGALAIPFDEAYPLVAWICWVPNLVVVEWWLTQRLSTTGASTGSDTEAYPAN